MCAREVKIMSDKKKKEQRRRGSSADEGNSSRRAFLKFGALAGAAGLMGAIPRIVAGEDGDSLAAPGDAEEADEVVRLLNQNGELVEVKKSAMTASAGDHAQTADRAALRAGVAGKSFVMVVDLASCRNARKCVDSCQHAHGLRPDQEYVKVKRMSHNELSGEYWMPQLCNHCDNPPCTTVCPVDATFKRDDGVVAIDNDRCIGCRFCMAACPYGARVFNWNEPKSLDQPPTCSSHTGQPKKKGTVDKCDFCAEMASEGELPHCVTACPNGVFYFGDRDEDVVTNGAETVRLTKLLEERGGYQYMAGLGTKPRVYYLPARNREFPFEQGEEQYDKAQEQMEGYRLDLNPSKEEQ